MSPLFANDKCEKVTLEITLRCNHPYCVLWIKLIRIILKLPPKGLYNYKSSPKWKRFFEKLADILMKMKHYSNILGQYVHY